MSAATHAQQPALFTAMLTQFRADLSVFNAQCHGGSAADVPWVCGDTTYYWKNTYATQYDTVYGGYKNRESEGVYFVPFMTDGNGVNTATNAPAEFGYSGIRILRCGIENEWKPGIIKPPDTFQFMGAQEHYSGSSGNRRYSERSRAHLSLHQW